MMDSLQVQFIGVYEEALVFVSPETSQVLFVWAELSPPRADRPSDAEVLASALELAGGVWSGEITSYSRGRMTARLVSPDQIEPIEARPSILAELSALGVLDSISLSSQVAQEALITVGEGALEGIYRAIGHNEDEIPHSEDGFEELWEGLGLGKTDSEWIEPHEDSE